MKVGYTVGICQQTKTQKQKPFAYCKVKQTMYLLYCVILYLEESKKNITSSDEHFRPYSSSSLTSSAARTVKMNG